MVHVPTGRRGTKLALALGCVLVAAAVTGAVLWPSPSDDAPRRAAKGPTGPNRPAYPLLLKHALAGATSVEIRGAAGITTIVKRPATVRQIVRWFAALPHPLPEQVSDRYASDWCSGYQPLDVLFDFNDGGGRVLLNAVDRFPGRTPICHGSISFNGRALADHDFLSRVSGLIGIDLTANRRTLQREEAAKRDALKLFRLVRVPPRSQLIATSPLTFDEPESHSVTAHRVWRVRLPFSQVYRWVKAHPPRGSGPGDYSNARGGSTNYGRETADRGDGYGYPDLAGGTERELNLDVWHYVRHGAWTRIRADVYETWTVARPSDAKIPSGVRTLVIHGLGRHIRRIARPDVVAQVVRWFDSRRVIQWFAGECGLRGPPYRGPVRITFLGAAGTVLASATDPRKSTFGGLCNPISLRVGRYKQPELDPGIDDSFVRLLR